MEIRQKRPRLPIKSNQEERQENNVFETETTENPGVYHGTGISKAKLPEIEMDELWQKKTYETTQEIDYKIEIDLPQSDPGNGEPKDITTETTRLDDIYNSFDFDHTM